MAELTTAQVWQELDKNIFAVVGMVTENGEARTAGVMYVERERKLYFITGKEAWKTRHIEQNPNVSVTAPLHRRVRFMPWIKIPAATITFSGTARIISTDDEEADITLLHMLFHGLEKDEEVLAKSCIIEITPHGDFVTYGVGVSVMTMRDAEKARGRVAVDG